MTNTNRQLTLREIRKMISDAHRKTTYFGQTNETYYPAWWAGYCGRDQHTSTSTHYDVGLKLATEHVASELGCLRQLNNYDIENVTRRREAADLVVAAYRSMIAADIKIDASLDDPIV